MHECIRSEAEQRRRPIRRLQIVIPVMNEAETVDALVRELTDTLSVFDLSILFVDDGSADTTLAELHALKSIGLPVDYVSLSRNFGKEAALMCGLMLAPDGFDALVTMDGDGQHPPKIILEMVEAAEQGNADLVIGVRNDRNDQHFFNRYSRRAFYAVFNALSKIQLPHGIGDFNLYRPTSVDAIRSLNECDLFLKGLVAWIGFDPAFVKYEVRLRSANATRWSFRDLLRLSVTGIMSFTDWPLRVWSLVGTFLAMISFSYLAVTLVQTLWFGSDVKGYPSLIMAILGLGGLQLLSVGILGGYLGRLYMESKQRPRYIVRESSLNANLRAREAPRTSIAK
jgi:glycosyltransferase involved in cell wall biosynthesis